MSVMSMGSSRWSTLALLLAAAGCSSPVPAQIDAAVDAPVDAPVDAAIDAVTDAGTSGSNPGFPAPTATTRANMFVGGAWMELGPADWSCLGTPSADQPSTQNLRLSGKVRDFQTSGNGVGNATITAFAGNMVAGNLGTAISDGAPATRGNYTMTLQRLPSGQTRYGFKLEALNYLRTYVLNQYFDPAGATQTRDLSAMSTATANAIVAFIGLAFDASTGTMAGTFRDCAGHTVSNAVATVSAVPGAVQHVGDIDTYYFSAGSSSLPVRHNVAPVMNKDGLFLIIDLPPQAAPAYAQIWGFRTQAELAAGTMTLLSELPTPIEASAIITGSYEPRRQ